MRIRIRNTGCKDLGLANCLEEADGVCFLLAKGFANVPLHPALDSYQSGAAAPITCHPFRKVKMLKHMRFRAPPANSQKYVDRHKLSACV